MNEVDSPRHESTVEKVIYLLGDLIIDRELSARSTNATNLLNTGDLTLANFEYVLGRTGHPAPKLFRLRSPTSTLKVLRKLNVKAVSLANNHAADFGYGGLAETTKILERHGIAHAGAGADLSEALKPAILNLGNFKIAFLACASDMPTDAIAMEDRPGLAPLRVDVQINYEAKGHQEYVTLYPNIVTKPDQNDLHNLLEAVKKVRNKVDLVVVSIHWGLSFQPMVMEHQMEIAHQLIDSGADIIMGHGPHVLHAIELYRSKPIFYSLGHFIFHKPKEVSTRIDPMKRTYQDYGFRWRTNETAVGKVVILGSKVAKVEMIPILIKDGDPVLCDINSAIPVLEYIKVLSRLVGTSVVAENGKAIAEKGLT
jgi:poly-gamma-glutamate capsule biosynthesis protein CapA/YwtB (metallophosphatase superfamily)